jgi:hypothetical protein
MKIIHIFNPKSDPNEGIWSIENEDGSIEFHKIFDEWEDPEHVYNFCCENLHDLHAKFGFEIDPVTAANHLMDEAELLKKELYGLAKKQPADTNLQQLFKPLYNSESNLTELQLSKGSIKVKNPKLRIYAVRIDDNTYVITGGAIKLTDFMKDRNHTQKELDKIKKAKTWLKSVGINFPEDLNELL